MSMALRVFPDLLVPLALGPHELVFLGCLSPIARLPEKPQDAPKVRASDTNQPWGLQVRSHIKVLGFLEFSTWIYP